MADRPGLAISLLQAKGHSVKFTRSHKEFRWFSVKVIKHTKIIKAIQRVCRKDQEGSLSGTGTAPGSATSRRAAWIHSTRPYASFDRRTKRTNMAFKIRPSFHWIVLPHRICVVSGFVVCVSFNVLAHSHLPFCSWQSWQDLLYVLSQQAMVVFAWESDKVSKKTLTNRPK